MNSRRIFFFVILANITLITVAEDAVRLPEKFNFPQYVPPRELALKIDVALIDGMRPPKYEGKVEIDGVTTDINWPGHIPATYQISERFYLIFEGRNSSKGFIWDAHKKHANDIGDIQIGTNTKFGHVVTRNNRDEEPQTNELLDFDPKTGKPVAFYRSELLGSLVGMYHGGLAFHFGLGNLLVLTPGEVPQKLKYKIEAGYMFANNRDAIRGDQVLLMQGHGGMRFMTGSSELFPYDVQAAILNLKTGEVKKIGSFKGGWSNHMALPRASYGIGWVTKEESKKLPQSRLAMLNLAFGGGFAYVVEGTEELVTLSEKEEE